MNNEKSYGTFVTNSTHVDKVHIGNWTIEKNNDESLSFAYKGVFQFVMKPDTNS